MTRYNYTPLGSRPPAPFVHITLANPGTNPPTEAPDLPAQIDSAADRTVIPSSLVTQLGLVPFSSLDVAGLGGVVARLSTYLVSVEVRNLPRLHVEVVAADEPWTLLGRDVLNRFRLVLDGPRQTLEID